MLLGENRREHLKILDALALTAVLALSAVLAGSSGPARASDCSVFNGNNAGCTAQPTCTWDQYSCSAFNNDPTACVSQSPCSYPGNAGDCSGFDESTCNAYITSGCNVGTASCSWNGVSCDGGGSCSGYGDEGSCISGWFFTGCSGGYDTGECTGTYEPGTCSGTYDGAAPTLTLGSPSVNGTTLTLAYDESLNEASVPSTGDFSVTDSVAGSIVVNSVLVTGSDVVLTIASGVTNYSALSISYTAGVNPIEDISGNNAADLSSEAVVNDTPDTFAPTLVKARVSGDTITLTYDENLDEVSVPQSESIEVTEGGNPLTLSARSVVGSTFVLTLSEGVLDGTEILISYSASGSPIRDEAGNSAASFSDELVIRVDSTAWTERTGAGSRSWTNIVSSADGTKLAAAVSGGYVYTSTDSGANWTERAGAGSRSWRGLTSSADGTALAASVSTGYIYTSTDSGANWTERAGAGSRSWVGVTSSSDGTKLAAVAYPGYIYTSTDSGANWTERTGSGSRTWFGIASSADGVKLAAAVISGHIYTSTDSGANWTERTGSGSRTWTALTSSSDGTKLVAASGYSAAEYIYTSVNSGANWTERTGAGPLFMRSLASSADGATLVAAVGSIGGSLNTGYVYVSTDSGTTWTEHTGAGLREWGGAAVSSDGTKVAVAAEGGYIYTTTLAGDTTAPTVLSASSNKAAGSYTVGEVIDIDIQFSEAVTSTGNVTVTLETGATDRACTFTVSGATSGTCNYTVQAGDTSADLTVSSVTGTVKDAALNTLVVPATPTTNLAANEGIVIDTSAPSAPTVDLPVSGDSAGLSLSDDITAVPIVDIDAACESDATVYLKSGNTVLGSGTCVAGTVSVGPVTLSEGLNTLAATQVDAAGNISATSSSLAITGDFTAPTMLSASSTKAAGAYGVGAVIDVDMQFSEAMASSEDITVTLETGATDRTCAFTVSNSTYATCDYTVQAGDTSADLTVSSISGHLEDLAGNDYDSAIASNLAANEAIVIDGVAPSVSLAAPSNGATVSGAAVALSATASDANLAGVQFKVDGVAEGAEDTGSPFGITWDSTGVADGSHTVAAVARDAAGNYATSSVTVTVSNAAPAGGEAGDGGERHSSSGRASRQRAAGGGSGSSGSDSSSGGSGSAGGATFARDLDVGSFGGDVRDLQRFLNARGFTVAASGPGSPGSETDLFGGLTRDALARFQAANGVVPAAGYLGPKTRTLIAALGGAAPTAGSSSDAAAYANDAAPARDLDLGAQGADVESLQLLLIRRAAGPAAVELAGYGPSGYFGALTQAALAELQRALGVSPAAGYYGARTRAALGL